MSINDLYEAILSFLHSIIINAQSSDIILVMLKVS